MKRDVSEHPDVTSFLRGDRVLVDEIQQTIDRVIQRFRTASVTRAELRQEVMSRIVANLRAGRFRGDASLRTYASNVAKYTCLEHFRRQRHETRLDEADGPQTPQLGPEEALLQTEEHLTNLKRFLALPRKSRTLLLLIFVEGLSYRQVAARLGISVGAVKLRVHRCRLAGKRAIKRDSPVGGNSRRLYRFQLSDRGTD